MTTAWSAVYDYLDTRGAAYGITAEDLLAKTPSIIQHDHQAVMSFWQQKDISHIVPTSAKPELAGDFNNWIPEDSGPNQARNDRVMSLAEHGHAQLDNLGDAIWLF